MSEPRPGDEGGKEFVAKDNTELLGKLAERPAAEQGVDRAIEATVVENASDTSAPDAEVLASGDPSRLRMAGGVIENLAELTRKPTGKELRDKLDAYREANPDSNIVRTGRFGRGRNLGKTPEAPDQPQQ